MNAVVTAYGTMIGGRGGARAALYNFWKKISAAGTIYSPLKQTPWEYFQSRWNENWNMDGSVTYQLFDVLTRMFSP